VKANQRKRRGRELEGDGEEDIAEGGRWWGRAKRLKSIGPRSSSLR